jgi:hypothetical protein
LADVSASDRTAQLNILYAISSEGSTFSTNNDFYPSAETEAADLNRPDSGLSFTAGTVSGHLDLSVGVSPNGEALVVAARSSDGRCWYATDNKNPVNGPTALPGPTAPLGISFDASKPDRFQPACAASTIGKAPLVGGWSQAFPGAPTIGG